VSDSLLRKDLFPYRQCVIVLYTR